MKPSSVTVTDASGGAKNSNAIILEVYAQAPTALQVTVTGTATYSVQATLDNVFDPSITPAWVDHPDATLVGATTTKQGNYAFLPVAIRVRQTAGNGSVRLTVLQAGNTG